MERITITRGKLERLSAGLLAVGLVVAIAVADDLPGVWSTALFAVLLVLDGITISWLTRPCDEQRSTSGGSVSRNRAGVGGTSPARCGAAR